MTETSCMPGRDRQRRIASLAAALSALVLVAGICSLQPRWQREIGPPPVNLGTAQMQAEAMALAIRQSPPPRLPVPPTPLLDQWRPQAQPQLTDPVVEDVYVMEQTLPYCWPGSSASTCQEVDDLVRGLDDEEPPDIHALRLQLQADLVSANRRSTPVPAAVLASACSRIGRCAADGRREASSAAGAGVRVNGTRADSDIRPDRLSDPARFQRRWAVGYDRGRLGFVFR